MKHKKCTEVTFASDVIGEVKRQKRRWVIAFWTMTGIAAVLSVALAAVRMRK